MYVKSLREQQEKVRPKNKLEKSNPNSFRYNIFILKGAPTICVQGATLGSHYIERLSLVY